MIVRDVQNYLLLAIAAFAAWNRPPQGPIEAVPETEEPTAAYPGFSI